MPTKNTPVKYSLWDYGQCSTGCVKSCSGFIGSVRRNGWLVDICIDHSFNFNSRSEMIVRGRFADYWHDLDTNISTDDPDQFGKVGKATQGAMRAHTLYLNKF